MANGAGRLVKISRPRLRLWSRGQGNSEIFFLQFYSLINDFFLLWIRLSYGLEHWTEWSINSQQKWWSHWNWQQHTLRSMILHRWFLPCIFWHEKQLGGIIIISWFYLSVGRENTQYGSLEFSSTINWDSSTGGRITIIHTSVLWRHQPGVVSLPRRQAKSKSAKRRSWVHGLWCSEW